MKSGEKSVVQTSVLVQAAPNGTYHWIRDASFGDFVRPWDYRPLVGICCTTSELDLEDFWRMIEVCQKEVYFRTAVFGSKSHLSLDSELDYFQTCASHGALGVGQLKSTTRVGRERLD